MIRLILLIIFVFSGLIFPQQQVDIPWPTLAKSPWPMVAHDPQITGRSPYSGPKTPTIKWILDLPYGVFSGPIIGENNTLYVGSRAYLGFVSDTLKNHFYAVSPEGEIKWTFYTDTTLANESGYLINNEGTIFFGSQSGWLYAIDTTGNLKWKYKTGGNIHQRVMNIDLQGNIYIANNTDSLYSFSKDGELNWKVKYGDGLFPSSVSISPDGNTLYTIASGGKIYALNLNGKIKWEFEVGNVNRPLTVDNAGNIYFLPGTMNGTIISFDSSGNIRWEYLINKGDAGLYNQSSPAIDYMGNIYYVYRVDSINTWFCRLESIDYYGNYRWTYQFNQPREYIMMPLVVDKDGTIYCGSSDGYNYYAVSKDGELLWQIPLDGYYVENSTAIGSDGTLYIGKCESSTWTFGKKTLIAIQDTSTVSVNENINEIKDYFLSQNYPNPFNPETKIIYQIKERGFVSLKIYDILGREVADLVNEEKLPGEYSAVFNSGSLASGVYIYSLRVNDFVQNKKMTLLK